MHACMHGILVITCSKLHDLRTTYHQLIIIFYDKKNYNLSIIIFILPRNK